jgi:uncharacterized membrane protein (DUF106 family)
MSFLQIFTLVASNITIFGVIVGLFSIYNGRATRREISGIIRETQKETQELIMEMRKEHRESIKETQELIIEMRKEHRELIKETQDLIRQGNEDTQELIKAIAK